MHPQTPKHTILQRQQIQYPAIIIPRNQTDRCAGQGVHDEVVGGGDDGEEDCGGVQKADGAQEGALEGAECAVAAFVG